MRIGLSKTMRLRTASILALLYTLCVLAPAAAFAFGDGSRAALCLTEENHGLRSVHAHEKGGKAHHHADGVIHEHSKDSPGKSSKGSDESSKGQCCGLVCLTALPASVSQVQPPTLPAMIAVCAAQEHAAGKGPERLYRPPIDLLSL